MRRTYTLLAFLIIVIVVLTALTYFRVKMGPPSLSNQGIIQPSPTLPIKVEPTITPTTRFLTYKHDPSGFSFTYTNHWDLDDTFDQDNHWKLSATEASSSAEFEFSISDSSASSSVISELSCDGVKDCQVLPINSVNYKMKITETQTDEIIISFQAKKGNYVLDVIGTLVGENPKIGEFANEWTQIVESFSWEE